jgi:DNA-binding transcriptional LysR family regulator
MAMPDRLTGMEVFAAAIRLGGLSAASRELGMSPAMATKHLDALEHRLGVTLVRRTTRRLALTEAGRHFLDRTEPLLSSLAEAESEALAANVAINGLLRVAVPVSFGTLHVAPLAAAFSRQYPEVTLELGLNDRYVDLMEEGWDVAVRIGRLADSSLIARKLAPATMVVAASPAYLSTHGVPRSVSELSRHDCLGFTLSPIGGAKTWSFGVKGEVKIPVRSSLCANNGEALVAAAIEGQGLVYGPRFIAASALKDGRLSALDLDVALFDLGAVYALTHPDRRPAAKTRAWIDFLASSMEARREELSGP